MKNKWGYIFGTITIGVIIGGTIYAIKKSKDAEKEEENAISLEEARKIVEHRDKRERADRKLKEYTDSEMFEEDMKDPEEVEGGLVEREEEDTLHFDMQEVELAEDIMEPKQAPINSNDDEGIDIYDDLEDVDEETEGPSLTVEPLNDFNYYEEGIDPKEDTEMRHDPNSADARFQYIRMELADWEPNHPIYRIALQSFEIPFIPTTDGDEVLRTQIIDHKVRFFGFGSRWVKEVSFADVIFHFARSAEFNCGESVKYWVEYFIDSTELEWDGDEEHFETIITRLNSHTYFNEERQTFGLFGLSSSSMDQAAQIANRNIDRSVTYEIEFNEFLKSCV